MVTAIALVAPVLEELLHRGLIFDLLSRRAGAIAASGIGTVLFVGMHFGGASGQVEPIRLVSLVTFSLAMYVVRVRWNSLPSVCWRTWCSTSSGLRRLRSLLRRERPTGQGDPT